MKILLSILLFIAAYSSALDFSGPATYYIDLDSSPFHRYDHVVQPYVAVIHDIHKQIKAMLPKAVHAFLEMTFDTVYKIGHKEYAEEIEGIAKALEITPTDTFVLNCIYELGALCTSIVARDPHNKVILARNLDFGFATVLRKLQ